MVSDWLGLKWPVYAIWVGLVMGGAAFAAGRAVAGTWRPLWQVVFYCALLACAARFLVFALLGGPLLSFRGLVLDFLIMLVWGLCAFRLTHVAKMVSQYPWLYERNGRWRYCQRRSAAPRE
jgi:branched-chain amino acid transport system ATP-binding protein